MQWRLVSPEPSRGNFVRANLQNRGKFMESEPTRIDRLAAETRPPGDQICPMRILVVEDDEKIASFVVKGLKQNGFAVDHSADGERALALALTVAYDTAIVDLRVPNLDGLSLIHQLRAKNIRGPVLILSARASVDDRVRGLQAG